MKERVVVGDGVKVGVEAGVSEGIAVGVGGGVHVGVGVATSPAQPAAENAKRIREVRIKKGLAQVLLIAIT